MKSKIDRIVIIIASTIVPLFIAFLLVKYLSNIKYDFAVFQGIEIIKTLIGVWSTLLGFMITAISILLTIGGNEYIKALRDSDHYRTVMFTQFMTCILLFLATVFSIIIICINVWNIICFGLLVFLLFSTFIGIGFCIFFLFFMIFKSR